MARIRTIGRLGGKAAAVIVAGLLLSNTAAAKGFKYYGNWGGPGHGGGQPIDTLDRAYHRHDQRYSQSGWVHSGRADGQLIEEALAASLNPFNDTHLHGRALGPISAAAFAIKPGIYDARILGKKVPIPSLGATSFAFVEAERGVKGVSKVGKKTAKGVSKALKKVF